LPYAAYPFGVAQGSARQLSPGHRSLAASREGQPGVDSGDDQPLASLFFAGLPGGGDNDKIALNPASRIPHPPQVGGQSQCPISQGRRRGAAPELIGDQVSHLLADLSYQPPHRNAGFGVVAVSVV
jgi:hypothetical protein